MSRGASAMSDLHGTRFVTHQTVTVPAYIAEYQRNLEFWDRIVHDIAVSLAGPWNVTVLKPGRRCRQCRQGDHK